MVVHQAKLTSPPSMNVSASKLKPGGSRKNTSKCLKSPASVTNTKPESSHGKDKPSTWSRRSLKTLNAVPTVRTRRSSSTKSAWPTRRPNKKSASRRCLKPPQPSTWSNSTPSSFQSSVPAHQTPRSSLLRSTTRNALTRRSRKCWRSSSNGGTCGNQNSSSTTVADSSAKSSSSPQSSTSTTSGDSARPISELASSTARYLIVVVLFRLNKK